MKEFLINIISIFIFTFVAGVGLYLGGNLVNMLF
jgi:hypothetical protein